MKISFNWLKQYIALDISPEKTAELLTDCGLEVEMVEKHELGLGESHAGIMVLDAKAKVGTPAKEYFKVESDYVLEIGLTPNRGDAASHMGIAKDLYAVLNWKFAEDKYTLNVPPVEAF